MSGILGDNYVVLSSPSEDIMAIAGIADFTSSSQQGKYLHQGCVIPLENTESAIDLGSLINTFVAGKDDDKNKE